MNELRFQERATDAALFSVAFCAALDLPLVQGRHLTFTLTEAAISLSLMVGLARRMSGADRWVPRNRFNAPLVACLIALGISGIAYPAFPGLAAKMWLRGAAGLALFWCMVPWLAERRRARLALAGLILGLTSVTFIGFLEMRSVDIVWPLLERFRERRMDEVPGTIAQVIGSETYQNAVSRLAQYRVFRMRSVMVSPNILGYVLAWGTLLLLGFIGVVEQREERWAMWLVPALWLAAMTITLSRGAFLVLLASLALGAAAALIRGAPGPKRRMVLANSALAAAIILLMTAMNGGFAHRLVGAQDEGARPSYQQENDAGQARPAAVQVQEPEPSRDTIQARRDLWSAAWRIFREHPIFGAGPDSFRMLFLENVPRKSELAYEMIGIGRAHNILLNTVAEQGIVGLAALLWLIWALLKAAIKVLWSRDIDPLKWAAACGAALFLLGNMIDHLADVYVYSILLWITLALLDTKSEPGA